MDVLDNFLHEVCDQFDNMVISGDFNLPDILWDSIDSASGVNAELAFIETLHDYQPVVPLWNQMERFFPLAILRTVTVYLTRSMVLVC